MDDIGVVMTPFGDVVTVILFVVANSHVFAKVFCHSGMLNIGFKIHKTISAFDPLGLIPVLQ